MLRFDGSLTVGGKPVVTRRDHEDLVDAVAANGQAIAAVAHAVAVNGAKLQDVDEKIDRLDAKLTSRMDRIEQKLDQALKR